MTYCAAIRLASFFSTTTTAAVVTVAAPEPDPEEVENQNVTATADMPNSYDTVILPPHHHPHHSSSSQLPPPPLSPPPPPPPSSSSSNKKSLINSIAKLRSIQRLWLLRITRAKFTTPNMALCLIADVEPIEITLLRRAVDLAVKRPSCRNSITNNHLMSAFSLLFPDRNVSESFMTSFFQQHGGLQSSTSQSIFSKLPVLINFCESAQRNPFFKILVKNYSKSQPPSSSSSSQPSSSSSSSLKHGLLHLSQLPDDILAKFRMNHLKNSAAIRTPHINHEIGSNPVYDSLDSNTRHLLHYTTVGSRLNFCSVLDQPVTDNRLFHLAPFRYIDFSDVILSNANLTNGKTLHIICDFRELHRGGSGGCNDLKKYWLVSAVVGIFVNRKNDVGIEERHFVSPIGSRHKFVTLVTGYLCFYDVFLVALTNIFRDYMFIQSLDNLFNHHHHQYKTIQVGIIVPRMNTFISKITSINFKNSDIILLEFMSAFIHLQEKFPLVLVRYQLDLERAFSLLNEDELIDLGQNYQHCTNILNTPPVIKKAETLFRLFNRFLIDGARQNFFEKMYDYCLRKNIFKLRFSAEEAAVSSAAAAADQDEDEDISIATAQNICYTDHLDNDRFQCSAFFELNIEPVNENNCLFAVQSRDFLKNETKIRVAILLELLYLNSNTAMITKSFFPSWEHRFLMGSSNILEPFTIFHVTEHGPFGTYFERFRHFSNSSSRSVACGGGLCTSCGVPDGSLHRLYVCPVYNESRQRALDFNSALLLQNQIQKNDTIPYVWPLEPHFLTTSSTFRHFTNICCELMKSYCCCGGGGNGGRSGSVIDGDGHVLN